MVYLADNRENVRQSMASTRDLLASLNDVVVKDRSKVERVLDGLEVDRVPAPTAFSTRPTRSAGQVVNIAGPQPARRSSGR